MAKSHLVAELTEKVSHLKEQVKLFEDISVSVDPFDLKNDKKLKKDKKKRTIRIKRKKKGKTELQTKDTTPENQLAETVNELEESKELLAMIEKRINDIRIKFLGFFQEVESEEEETSEEEKGSKKDSAADSTKGSNADEERPKFSKAEFDDAQAILYALGQGGEVAINALKEAHYEDEDQEVIDAAFGRFIDEDEKDLENSYLFLEGNEDILQATVELLDYFLKLQKDEESDKKIPVFVQKSAENKIDGLVNLIQNITRAETLTDISTALKSALKGRGEHTLQWNRGPFGKYWVGSMFKGLRNPIDNKFINSTTEHKVAQLYNAVFAKEVVESLFSQDLQSVTYFL